MSFDFDAAIQVPFRMQPGLRRLAAGSRQLTVSARDGQHLREKLAVLRAHAEGALLQSPGFDARPALSALAKQAAAEHPMAFAWDGETATSHLLGWQVRDGDVFEVAGGPPPLVHLGECLRNLPASWRLAGLMCLAFAEDFAIIDGLSAHIPWLAVALPSHWAPGDKVGRHFVQVHAPVADNRHLLAAGEALARLVTADTRWERFVWSIGTSASLNLHPSLPRQPWRRGDVGTQAVWRTERQTFIPVPERRQAVFTILVETQPLSDALDSADRARRLHDAVASMSADVLRYRGLLDVRDELLSWLAHRDNA
jgi:hypothetical protein